MESGGVPGRIQISYSTYDYVKERYLVESHDIDYKQNKFVKAYLLACRAPNYPNPFPDLRDKSETDWQYEAAFQGHFEKEKQQEEDIQRERKQTRRTKRFTARRGSRKGEELQSDARDEME
eukprot:NODE_1525_length_587_cov_221.525862_g1512_i0.p1 GENE.NODE_1525_length_587_cov_221.525862_g1512_i0~~NODE_1525_length_587_cov_221.525862_g1512_i0.p1  ORF type:complete len:121 (+),score=14.13 NODE_1525_length_587_cov_221.525862_g1512_i0:96-458(+)